MTHCFCLGIASIPEWLNCKPVNQRYFNRNIIIFFNQNNFCFIRVMILLPRSDFVGTWSSPRVSHRRVIWPNPETLWWLWWVTESFGVFNRSRYLLLLRSFKHPIKKKFQSLLRIPAIKTFTGLKIAVTHGKFLEQKVPEEREYDSKGDLNNIPWVNQRAGEEKEEQQKKRSFKEDKRSKSASLISACAPALVGSQICVSY